MARRRPWARRPGVKSNSKSPAPNTHCGRQVISTRTGISFLTGITRSERGRNCS
jgi:hypothetical protein